jgi:DNA-binding transcriptional regulator of glucitol operon
MGVLDPNRNSQIQIAIIIVLILIIAILAVIWLKLNQYQKSIGGATS